jgi:hypothetical protein
MLSVEGYLLQGADPVVINLEGEGRKEDEKLFSSTRDTSSIIDIHNPL